MGASWKRKVCCRRPYRWRRTTRPRCWIWVDRKEQDRYAEALTASTVLAIDADNIQALFLRRHAGNRRFHGGRHQAYQHCLRLSPDHSVRC